LTRPSAAEIGLYRRHVDAAMEQRLSGGRLSAEAQALIELGLAHEEQHQELLLTDILHLFAQNPLKPVYDPALAHPAISAAPEGEAVFLPFEGGVVEIGQRSGEGFAFDNEGPRHEVLLRPYRLADRLVTNADWLAFMADDGYRRPELWLSEGFARVEAEGWSAPLYWDGGEGGWTNFTLGGLRRTPTPAGAACACPPRRSGSMRRPR
jgi:formylglycine-generating enzyme required for sulfatase activity